MPHVCGDEPAENSSFLRGRNVCPTYVGMNRTAGMLGSFSVSMPHVCGDEPKKLWI